MRVFSMALIAFALTQAHAQGPSEPKTPGIVGYSINGYYYEEWQESFLARESRRDTRDIARVPLNPKMPNRDRRLDYELSVPTRPIAAGALV